MPIPVTTLHSAIILRLNHPSISGGRQPKRSVAAILIFARWYCSRVMVNYYPLRRPECTMCLTVNRSLRFRLFSELIRLSRQCGTSHRCRTQHRCRTLTMESIPSKYPCTGSVRTATCGLSPRCCTMPFWMSMLENSPHVSCPVRLVLRHIGRLCPAVFQYPMFICAVDRMSLNRF